MENKLKCRPVMLPTQDVTKLHRQLKDGYIYYSDDWYPKLEQCQYLYLVSDEEIKEGDWVMNITPMADHIWKAGWPSQIAEYAPSTKKIEATTDLSLGLPLIPQKWIKEVYVAKQGKVDEVYIMFEPDFGGMEEYPFHLDPDKYPKKITILPSKDSWNREEVKEIALRAYTLELLKEDCNSFDEWFDKNY